MNSVSYSRDGNGIAVASSDGIAWVWDAANGRLRLTLHGPSGAINGIAFSPDNKFVATAGQMVRRKCGMQSPGKGCRPCTTPVR